MFEDFFVNSKEKVWKPTFVKSRDGVNIWPVKIYFVLKSRLHSKSLQLFGSMEKIYGKISLTYNSAGTFVGLTTAQKMFVWMSLRMEFLKYQKNDVSLKNYIKGSTVVHTVIKVVSG